MMEMNRAILITLVILLAACGDSAIDQRLAALSGSDYMALNEDEKQQLVAQSLARFTTWRFWARPDLCEHVLNPQSIYTLYAQAADKAQDKPMMFNFAVLANNECAVQGQLIK